MHIARLTTLASLAALSGALAFAQQTLPPPPAQAPDPHAQHGHMGGPGGPAMGPEAQGKMRHDGEGMRGMHGEGRILPPGMWWKNPDLVTRIGLTPDQTRKMDEIFQSSRLKLIDLKANVERQEVTLEPMLSANPIDSKAALTQIGHVADARADLEKANAGMLLSIRAVLTPEQWTKLQAGERGPRRGGMTMGANRPGPTLAAPPEPRP